ncbi:unnamed protein product [Effrenium voratum]|nr:unnamed protein product [Effrenium voratum]
MLSRSRQVPVFRFARAASTLQELWASGASVTDIAAESCDRAARADRHEWVHLVPKQQVLAEAKALQQKAASMSQEQRRRELPLLGSTFAVKDNLQVAGLPTTNAMDYRPPRQAPIAKRSAAVVKQLQERGAVCIGKANMDCAALKVDRSFISGGSSSGSGVSVALAQVTFSLGTDTAPALDRPGLYLGNSKDKVMFNGPMKILFGQAGSGRVPAALNNIVGLKARADDYRQAWERSVEALKAIGGTCVEVDYAPFQEAANLLYQGPWVAERLSACADLLADEPELLDATVKTIVENGTEYTAKQCFEAIYQLQQLRFEAMQALNTVQAQVLVTPTVGATYTIEDVLADPVVLNTNLGRYTNHMNLLDLCGISVPTTFAAEKLPFGVTVSAVAGHDALICDVAQRLHSAAGLTAGATTSAVQDVAAAVEATEGKYFGPLPAGAESFEVAVCGAHMEGLALSWQLTERGGRFMRTARTSPRYRLVAFDGMSPPRPGLVDDAKGAGIDLEIWELGRAKCRVGALHAH